MVEYTTISGKTSYWFCRNCYEDKLAREAFQNKVCMIFGIKAPGPVIWTQRKRLMNKYGYTDQVIIDCLDYIYNVEHKLKLAESLGLVTPTMVEKSQKWKHRQQIESAAIGAAANTKLVNHFVNIKENDEVIKEDYNPDDWLED